VASAVGASGSRAGRDPRDPLGLLLPPLGDPPFADLVYAEAELLFPGGDDVLREMLNDAAGALGPGSRALLLGDDTGRAARYMTEKAGLRCVVASGPGKIAERGRARLQAAGLMSGDRAVEWKTADLLALPGRLGRGKYDAVIAEGSLHGMSIAEGIDAAEALLAPGGVLAFTALCYVRPPSEAHRAYWDAVLAHDPPGIQDDVMVLLGDKGFGGGVAWPLSRAHWERYHAPLRARVAHLRKAGAQAPLLDRLESEMRIIHDEDGASTIGPVAFIAQLQE